MNIVNLNIDFYKHSELLWYNKVFFPAICYICSTQISSSEILVGFCGFLSTDFPDKNVHGRNNL